MHAHNFVKNTGVDDDVDGAYNTTDGCYGYDDYDNYINDYVDNNHH